MLSSVTSSELTELLAFYQINQFGLDRDDLRAGVVASAVFNAGRTDDNQKIWSASDFLLYPEAPPDPTDDDIAAALDAFFGAGASE